MKIQLASMIYLSNLNTVKKILDLIEYREGKESEKFVYLKKQLFDYLYLDVKKLFIKLEQEKIIKKCPKGCSMRQGYTSCLCNGSGYVNYE
jgi:hypothetical protein